ncbi:MAG: hypothetical protein MJB57_09230 [Gemmatimonadetes bacterium]|nr:hypothetical protein [Gemmatimonadota bacterium]
MYRVVRGHPALRARFGVAALLLVVAGCASTNPVALEPLGPRYAPTIWESIEILSTADEVQRSFIPLAHLRITDAALFLEPQTIEWLQREASRVGANALLLTELGRPGGDNGSWAGVATAIRVLDARWADRYWRYGAAPDALQGPDVDALSPNRRPRPTTTTGRVADDGPPAGPVEPDMVESGWHRIIAWTGSGVERTEDFTVPSGEWRVIWEAVTGDTRSLEILVFETPSDELVARIDQDGVGTGSYLGLAGGGTYYLAISGEGVSWEIGVDAWTASR